MTTATNVYDLNTHSFPDKILYYPALGGNIDNPPYPPIEITNLFIHATMISASPDEHERYNIAFLKLDETYEKPVGYFGFRYQYASYVGEGTMLLGYPNDLPDNVDNANKGTYMYRGSGKISSCDSTFIFHSADTSDGQEGAPLYVLWDAKGWTVIGINAYNRLKDNVAVRLSRLVYGAMKTIRNGGMNKVVYTQPVKPDNTSFIHISELYNAFEKLGEMYATYYFQKHEVNPALRIVCIGICNYLRHIQYGDWVWTATLLDSIDTQFIKYVKTNDLELYNELNDYIKSDGLSVKDTGIGGFDLPHFAATLEGYIGLTPAPDFWTGWGGDLASGMANTSNLLSTFSALEISNYTITQCAFETIRGKPYYSCYS